MVVIAVCVVLVATVVTANAAADAEQRELYPG
jgi:hypothetical protein